MPRLFHPLWFVRLTDILLTAQIMQLLAHPQCNWPLSKWAFMNSYGVVVKLHSFLNLLLDWAEWLASRPGHFTTEERARLVYFTSRNSLKLIDRDSNAVKLFMLQSVPEWRNDDLTFMETVAARWRQTVALLVYRILTPVNIWNTRNLSPWSMLQPHHPCSSTYILLPPAPVR